MRKAHLTLCFLVFGMVLAGSAHALTPVKDNFNKGPVNKSRWTFKKFDGDCRLATLSKAVHFTAKSKGDSAAYLELRNNRPGTNENWQAFVDVSNTANKGDDVGLGLWVVNAADTRDSVFLEFYGKKGGFNSIRVTDGKDRPKTDVGTNPKVNDGSIRISFDKSKQQFSFWYDRTGSRNGYQWERLGTFSAKNWKMDPKKGQFIIRLVAYSDVGAVADGRVTFDNFRLSQ